MFLKMIVEFRGLWIFFQKVKVILNELLSPWITWESGIIFSHHCKQHCYIVQTAWVLEFGEPCCKHLLRYRNKKVVFIPFANYYYLHAVHYFVNFWCVDILLILNKESHDGKYNNKNMGVFTWLFQRKVHKMMIRQINQVYIYIYIYIESIVRKKMCVFL